MLRSDKEGPLKFNKGTEQHLLDYVKKNATKGNLDEVIYCIDKFCWNNHWMMNLGDEKAKHYRDTLQKYKCKSVLEFGCYMGYSALVALHTMGLEGSVTTIDPNTRTNKLASEMFEYAGVSNRVFLLEGVLSDYVKQLNSLRNKKQHIKPSVSKRLQKQKAVYIQKIKDKEQ